MKGGSKIRVAWLLPSMARGSYLHPVLSKFSEIYPQTTIFTGNWPGYAKGYEDKFQVEVVGKTRLFFFQKQKTGYSRGVVVPPIGIILHLLRYKPDLVFTSTFTIWSMFAILLKFFIHHRVVVVYSGSSPTVDARDDKFRLGIRKLISKYIDAFITNSNEGKNYIVNYLGVKQDKVFAFPYQIPDPLSLSRTEFDPLKNGLANLSHPIFLYVGRVVYGKGIHLLFEACKLIKQTKALNFTLLILGDGDQRKNLESTAVEYGIQENIRWVGWVDYGSLGHYYKNSDVFVFPSLDDVWGMVVLEAMLFNKPVLCSKFAGAAELVMNGKNGYVFDPYRPEEIAKQMVLFINDESLAQSMGEYSGEIMSTLTPETLASQIASVANSL